MLSILMCTRSYSPALYILRFTFIWPQTSIITLKIFPKLLGEKPYVVIEFILCLMSLSICLFFCDYLFISFDHFLLDVFHFLI